MGIEPSALGIVDNADYMDIGMLGQECTQMAGIGCMVVAGNDKIMAWEVVHHGQQCMELFLFLDFTNGKEEGTRGAESFGLRLGTNGEVFNAVIYYIGGFVMKVDKSQGIVHGKT